MAEETVARFIATYDDSHTYAWAIEHDGRLAGTTGAQDYVRRCSEKEKWRWTLLTEHYKNRLKMMSSSVSGNLLRKSTKLAGH